MNTQEGISRIRFSLNKLYISSGVQYAFSIGLQQGRFVTDNIVHLIRPYDRITDFSIDQENKNIWCVGYNSMVLQY